jgi:hypothetical protein
MKRVTTLIRLYWQAGKLNDAFELTYRYLDSLTLPTDASLANVDADSNSSSSSVVGSIREFGLESSLADPNPPLEVIIPHNVVQQLLESLDGLAEVNNVARKASSDLRALMTRVQKLCKDVSDARRFAAGLAPRNDFVVRG